MSEGRELAAEKWTEWKAWKMNFRFDRIDSFWI